MKPAIIFHRVSKRYSINTRRSGDLRALLAHLLLRPAARRDFLALDDVSFEVAPGEALGIIGRNGAGKSTIMKLLARITRPTKGAIRVNGRVAPLIEVGAGFHLDLSGRDNIYLNGSLLGLKRSEIKGRFDSIVEFAELAAFIDEPIKHYSSGMQMRLGFAVAAHLDPEILLVDEVLAVGDLVFQRKCLSAIDKLHRQGTTIVFISHALEAVASLCGRVLFLDRGRIAAVGAPDTIIAEYRRHVFERTAPTVNDANAQSGPVRITDVRIEDDLGEPRRVFRTGETIVVRGAFEATEEVPDPVFHVSLHRADGVHCFGTNTLVDGHTISSIKGQGSFTLTLPGAGLMSSSYLISVRVSGRDMYTYFDSHEREYGIVVDRCPPGWGAFYMPHAWTLPTTLALQSVGVNGQEQL